MEKRNVTKLLINSLINKIIKLLIEVINSGIPFP